MWGEGRYVPNDISRGQSLFIFTEISRTLSLALYTNQYLQRIQLGLRLDISSIFIDVLPRQPAVSLGTRNSYQSLRPNLHLNCWPTPSSIIRQHSWILSREIIFPADGLGLLSFIYLRSLLIVKLFYSSTTTSTQVRLTGKRPRMIYLINLRASFNGQVGRR